MHFEENQLSPSLISLSPLPTPHPQGFQPSWVRTSTHCYTRFILDMGRSLGFGSAACNYVAHFGLAFAAASRLIRLTSLHTSNSPAHYAKGTRSPPRRSKLPRGQLPLLVGTWFQVLFHSPPGVLFTFPSRYWFTIGQLVVFSLWTWSSEIPTRFLVPRGTWETARRVVSLRLPDCHRLWCPFPGVFD